MTRQRTPCMDCSSAAAIALVALALGGCPPRPGPEPMEPPSNQPMTGEPGTDGELVPGQTGTPADADGAPSPDPNEPSPTPGPPTPPPPPGAVDPTRPPTP